MSTHDKVYKILYKMRDLNKELEKELTEFHYVEEVDADLEMMADDVYQTVTNYSEKER